MPAPSTSSNMRLFVALPVPEDVKAALTEAQRELRRHLPEGAVRWNGRGQFHLTLRFLGAVEAGSVSALIDTLRRVCAASPSLHLRVAGLGLFPAHRPPRVIWAGAEDQARGLNGLQSAVQTATLTFTRELPEAGFRPHVTLGRVKRLSHSDARALLEHVATSRSQVFGAWTCGQADLMRSELAPDGAKHTLLDSFPLQ